MGGAFQGYVRSIEVNPRELGLLGETIAAGVPVTSEPFSIAGWAQLSWVCEVTRVAATAVAIYVETSHDGTTWHRCTSSSITAGAETVDAHTINYVDVATIPNWQYHFGGILGHQARLVIDSTAGTTDTITVIVSLGVVG